VLVSWSIGTHKVRHAEVPQFTLAGIPGIRSVGPCAAVKNPERCVCAGDKNPERWVRAPRKIRSVGPCAAVQSKLYPEVTALLTAGGIQIL
jgi:hypothetical protein